MTRTEDGGHNTAESSARAHSLSPCRSKQRRDRTHQRRHTLTHTRCRFGTLHPRLAFRSRSLSPLSRRLRAACIDAMGGGCSRGSEVRDARAEAQLKAQQSEAEAEAARQKERQDNEPPPAEAAAPAPADDEAPLADTPGGDGSKGADGLPSVAPIDVAPLAAAAAPPADPEPEPEPAVPAFNLPRIPSLRALPECPPLPTMPPVPGVEPSVDAVEIR